MMMLWVSLVLMCEQLHQMELAHWCDDVWFCGFVFFSSEFCHIIFNGVGVFLFLMYQRILNLAQSEYGNVARGGSWVGKGSEEYLSSIYTYFLLLIHVMTYFYLHFLAEVQVH